MTGKLLWTVHRRTVMKGGPPLRGFIFLGAVLAAASWFAAVFGQFGSAMSVVLLTLSLVSSLGPAWLAATTYLQAPDTPYWLMLSLGRTDLAPVAGQELRREINGVWQVRLGLDGLAAYRLLIRVQATLAARNLLANTVSVIGLVLASAPIPVPIRGLGALAWIGGLGLSLLRFRAGSQVVAQQVASSRAVLASALGWQSISSTPPAPPERFEEWWRHHLERESGETVDG